MARPVEQPVTMQTPPARSTRRSVPRGGDAEGNDFLTALRGADQKKAAAPAEPSGRPEAAKTSAAGKPAGKSARARKRQDQAVSADEQTAEATDMQAGDALAPQAEPVETEAESAVPGEKASDEQPGSVAKGDTDPTPATVVDPAAIVASTAVALVTSAQDGERPEGELDAAASADAVLGDEQLWPLQTPGSSSSAQSKPGTSREPVGLGMQAPTDANEQHDEPADAKATGAQGFAVPEEMQPANEELAEDPAAEPQVAKVEVNVSPAGLSHGLSINTTAKQPHQVAVAPPPAPAPEVQFAEANHDKIVTAVRGQLLPDGGQMRIRLDPPELGALWVRVQVQGGMMTASFETSNEQATRALSHSLSQLKHALEAGGVTVDKLQVAQAPKGQDADLQGQRDQQQQQGGQDFRGGSSQRDQQRQELVQKMWEKIALGRERVDLKA